MTIKVTNEILTYDGPAKPDIRVHSHWSDPKMVVLDFGDEKRTVDARDLLQAINNATNTGY